MGITPAFVDAIVSTSDRALRDGLAMLKARGIDASNEALSVAQQSRGRVQELNTRFWDGKLKAVDFARACESEIEALKLNLASIPGEQERKIVGDVWGASLNFLGSILSVGLRAIGG